jgi:Zn-finger nucleic acid-binding protein
MRCPVCRVQQVIVELEGVELDACASCGGLWFDAQEVSQLFRAVGLPAERSDLDARLRELSVRRPGRRRRCPRCERRMRQVEAPGPSDAVILDRCPAGHGLFFDHGELAALLHAEIGGDEPALLRVRQFLGAFAAPAAKGGS